MGLLEKLNNKSTELINIFMDSLYIYVDFFYYFIKETLRVYEMTIQVRSMYARFSMQTQIFNIFLFQKK